MEILLQLGADETAFIQFFLFILTTVFLTIFVYGPYYKAYDQRAKLTKGADLIAIETQDEAKKLEQIFQVRAREINTNVKEIFDKSRNQAADAATQIIQKAKDEIVATTEVARLNIQKQKQNATDGSKAIAEEISGEISRKLMGANQ